MQSSLAHVCAGLANALARSPLNHATRALLHALELALFHLKISAIMLN